MDMTEWPTRPAESRVIWVIPDDQPLPEGFREGDGEWRVPAAPVPD